MKKIITLRDKVTQKPIYPITTLSAVYDENNKTVEEILNEKLKELDELIQESINLAKTAEDSIKSLTNLNNPSTAQEEIEELKKQIESNQINISILKNNYDELKRKVNDLIKVDDITNKINSDSTKIPTTEAVEYYVQEKVNNIMEYIIDTTSTVPNYIPESSGQILVNTENNIIYFSPGGSKLWFAIKAIPIELPDSKLEGYIKDTTLGLIGNVEVNNNTIIINGTSVSLVNNTLVIPGTKISSTNVENNTLNVLDNSNINDSTLGVGFDAAIVENNTLIL